MIRVILRRLLNFIFYDFYWLDEQIVWTVAEHSDTQSTVTATDTLRYKVDMRL